MFTWLLELHVRRSIVIYMREKRTFAKPMISETNAIAANDQRIGATIPMAVAAQLDGQIVGFLSADAPSARGSDSVEKPFGAPHSARHLRRTDGLFNR